MFKLKLTVNAREFSLLRDDSVSNYNKVLLVINHHYNCLLANYTALHFTVIYQPT